MNWQSNEKGVHTTAAGIFSARIYEQSDGWAYFIIYVNDDREVASGRATSVVMSKSVAEALFPQV